MKRHCDPRLSGLKQSHITKACVFNIFLKITSRLRVQGRTAPSPSAPRNNFITFLITTINYYRFLKRLWKNGLLRGWWKMSICKASEVPKNEAYTEVRRNDEGRG